MINSINELECMIKWERSAKIICAELNNFVDLKSALIIVINHIKKLTGCEKVSIRLHDDEDYSYYIYSELPESFINKNSLCAKDENGNIIISPNGKGYLLECMCGNIIRGRFDPSLPFFTEYGSFWSNNTSDLLASTSDEERQSGTGNYYNSFGYESVALVPIKVGDERVGLIQLNDMRVGIFTEDLIEFVEVIGEQIGLALKKSLTIPG